MNGPERRIYDAALAAADPYKAVRRFLTLAGDCLRAGELTYALDGIDELLVVGGGKAAAAMGRAVEEVLGERIGSGLLVTVPGGPASLRRIPLARASHPLPDAAGAAAARKILALLEAAGPRALVLCLLSGGASALLAAPAPGLSLEDKQQATSLLLGAGAAIDELNAVRKHLSAVKGGRLARAAHPAALLTLILSDVIGDRLDVIASGPTAPDPTTFADAAAVIERYRLWPRLPAAVAAHLRRGLAGEEAETVKDGDPCFASASHLVVGSLGLALEAAAAEAARLGFAAEIVSRELQGEARQAARFLAQRARAELGRQAAGGRRGLLCGGETTVTVRGSGRGGRNQELALAFALEIAGCQGVTLLAAGSDGIDGPTDAAGALVDGGTVAAAARLGLDAADFLARNDSYTFFEELERRGGGRRHLKTGPSGTNVMDLQIVRIGRD